MMTTFTSHHCNASSIPQSADFVCSPLCSDEQRAKATSASLYFTVAQNLILVNSFNASFFFCPIHASHVHCRTLHLGINRAILNFLKTSVDFLLFSLVQVNLSFPEVIIPKKIMDPASGLYVRTVTRKNIPTLTKHKDFSWNFQQEKQSGKSFSNQFPVGGFISRSHGMETRVSSFMKTASQLFPTTFR